MKLLRKEKARLLDLVGQREDREGKKNTRHVEMFSNVWYSSILYTILIFD